MADATAPTGIGILADERRVNDLLQQKSGVAALFRSGCNILLFILFIVLYSVLVLGENLAAQRAFEGWIRRRFDLAGPMGVQDVHSQSGFWDYAQETLLPGFYGNNTGVYYLPGATVAKLLPMDGSNVLVGVARIRTKQVTQNADCTVTSTFKSHFPNCYGPFSPEAEDKKGFGPVTDSGISAFAWQDTADEPYRGQYATYGSGGYLQVLTANYPKTIREFDRWKNQGLVHLGTRAIFIDFSVFNFNLGYYGVCRMTFEISPNGNWVNKFDVVVVVPRHLSPLGNNSSSDWSLLVGEFVLMLFVLRYLIEEIQEFIQCDSSNGSRRVSINTSYFVDAWNLVDLSNLVLMVVALAIRIITWGIAGNFQVYLGDPAKQGLDTFSSLFSVGQNVRAIRQVLVFNSILTWFKAVKYLDFIPFIPILLATVVGSTPILVSWFFIWICMIFGFVVGFTLAFGDLVPAVSSFWNTFVFLLRTFLGDSDFRALYTAESVLATILIIAYIVLVIIITSNLFYAIAVNAYTDVNLAEEHKANKTMNQTLERLGVFLRQVAGALQMEERFKRYMPGLASRLKQRRIKQAKLEKARDEYVIAKRQHRELNMIQDFGPNGPDWGRRPKRVVATMDDDDGDEKSDSEGSEVDLGPMRPVDKNQLALSDGLDPKMQMSIKGALALKDAAEHEVTKEPEGPQEETAAFLDATRHIASGVCQRTHSARNVLLGEMRESQEVLEGINVVLQVLSQRARDIETQQKQLFKRHAAMLGLDG